MLEAFLYGWAAGIIVVIVAVLYGFEVLHQVVRAASYFLFGASFHTERPGHLLSTSGHSHVQSRRECTPQQSGQLADRGLEGIVDSNGFIFPAKVASSCVVGWYEPLGETGSPLDARIVLQGGVLYMYESFSQENETTGRSLYAEYPRGRIDISRLEVREVKPLSKDRKPSSNPLGGKLLMLSRRGGGPVFTSHETDTPSESFGSFTGSGGNDGQNSVSAGIAVRSPSTHEAVAAGKMESSIATQNSTDSIHVRWGTKLRRTGISTWHCVVLKFPSARESERWYTLLRGLNEVEAWLRFIRTMPSQDTANLFLSRFVFQSMREDGLTALLLKALNKALRKVSLTKFPRDLSGNILLDDLVLGTQIPSISNVSEPSLSETGEMGFDFNLTYDADDGGLSLYFRLALAFRSIRIPHVYLMVKVIRLQTRVHVSVSPPPAKCFWISCRAPPVLRVEVRQGCASGKGLLHNILTSLPDLSGIATNLIKLYAISDLVLPYMDDFPLPNIAKTPPVSPRSKAQKATHFDRRRAAVKSAAPVNASTPLHTDTSVSSPKLDAHSRAEKQAMTTKAAAATFSLETPSPNSTPPVKLVKSKLSNLATTPLDVHSLHQSRDVRNASVATDNSPLPQKTSSGVPSSQLCSASSTRSRELTTTSHPATGSGGVSLAHRSLRSLLKRRQGNGL